jgi:enoyl-CoA hydratase/carnithine racemase
MSAEVAIETAGATRIVTIQRPEARNALTLPTLGALAGAFEDAATDAAVRCVVITGAGGTFCSGADLRRTLPDDWQDPRSSSLEASMDAFHRLVKSVVRCPKPTVAMIDGAAVGFGADLAFACDLRVASTRAYVQEKFVKIGLMPDGGGTFWLPRLVGTARAMQMILLAEQMTATELERLGVVARVVEPDALRDAALAIARELEAGPPLAFAAIKRSLYAAWGSIEDALRREREEQLALLRSQDFAEGLGAWAEKRTPRFCGR